MNQPNKTGSSRKERTEFERNVQLQIREYEARYYPSTKEVATMLSAEKFSVDADSSSCRGPSNRKL